ncbi:hypothetical protein KAF44_20830 (plasmid) [Cupriavidus necator]|nr:hypothetical protein KAF44_20830 [Cupriavidus necator]
MSELSVETEWRAVEGEPVTMALREAGRPVLVIPFAEVFPTVGTRVMLAWNGSREATRALHDSIPRIAGAQVSILNVQTTSNEMRADAERGSSPAG